MVKLFWQFENKGNLAKHYTVLPDGFFDLVIFVENSEIKKITLFGVWSKQIEVIVPPYTTVLGVAFSPLAAEYFFKQSISDIYNGQTDVSQFLYSINDLPINNFAAFCIQFTNKICKNVTIDNRKAAIFKALFMASGNITVLQLSKSIYWSSRQINRYFKQYFGLSLKTYANILRCSSTYLQIEAGKLTAPLQFYDQSHFIKEIKKYTGANPKELHENKNDRFLQLSNFIK